MFSKFIKQNFTAAAVHVLGG